jgi:hypothetical protein
VWRVFRNYLAKYLHKHYVKFVFHLYIFNIFLQCMLKYVVFPHTFHIETVCNSATRMTNEFSNRINLCSNAQVVSCGCSLLKYMYVCVFDILYLVLPCEHISFLNNLIHESQAL